MLQHLERRHKDHPDLPTVMQETTRNLPANRSFSRSMGADESTFLPELNQLREGLLEEIDRMKTAENEQRHKMEATLQREREVLKQKEEELDKAQQQQYLKYEMELRNVKDTFRNQVEELKVQRHSFPTK